MRATELLKRAAEECAWEAVNLGFVSVQQVVWFFSGTTWRLYQSRKPENFEKSAQVLKIIGKFKFDEYLSPAKKSDFLLTHEGFDTPERVMKDHASLYQVTDREAIFVEASPGEDLWRARFSPFLCFAQFQRAVRVIRMPIASFHRLADRIGDPDNLTFIVNTARCGSTMLTQMFEETGQIVAMSEPSALNVMTKLAEAKKGGCEELNRMIVSTVRMLCKPTELRERAYVLKLTGPATPRLSAVMKLFPKSKALFMYRDGLKTSQSIYRLSEEIPSIKTIFWVGRNSRARLSWTLSTIGFPSEDYRVILKHPLSFGAHLWSLLLEYYLKFRKDDLPIVAIRYEDVVVDPEGSMRRILAFCGLPEELSVGCRRALEFDSQKDTPLSSAVLSRHPTLEYSGEPRVESDAIVMARGLPPWSAGPFILPGTITASGDDDKKGGKDGVIDNENEKLKENPYQY